MSGAASARPDQERAAERRAPDRGRAGAGARAPAPAGHPGDGVAGDAPAGDDLGLQRAAGNAALRSLLARRAGGPNVLQRGRRPGCGACRGSCCPGRGRRPPGPQPGRRAGRRGRPAAAGTERGRRRRPGAADHGRLWTRDHAPPSPPSSSPTPPLVADGVAGLTTWAKLDELAPRVSRQGRSVVEGRPRESREELRSAGSPIRPFARTRPARPWRSSSRSSTRSRRTRFPRCSMSTASSAITRRPRSGSSSVRACRRLATTAWPGR